MKLILRPHPRGGEVIDVYDGTGDLPWCNVSSDMFFYGDDALWQALYKDGKSVIAELTWEILDE